MELTPAEIRLLRQIPDGSYRQSSEQEGLTQRLQSLEDKGLIYLSPGGYGTTDAGKDALEFYGS